MELSAERLFRPKWSNMIHEEWISNLLDQRKDLERAKLERTRDLMNTAIPDCLVEGFEDLIEGLSLPDKNDRHVLAAAIHSSCDAIVTFNLKDFPASAVGKYDIEIQHPDMFIMHQFELKPPGVVLAARRCRARLRNPPKSPNEYLAKLEAQGLVKTVAELSNYAAVI